MSKHQDDLVVMISDNPFGMIGTPGTYLLCEELVHYYRVILVCPHPNNKSEIVYEPKSESIEVISSNWTSNDWQDELLEMLSIQCPKVVYFASGRSWSQNNGLLTKKIKAVLPKVKILVDLKSPPTFSSKKQLTKLQSTSSASLPYIDLVISRTEYDIFKRFGTIDIPYRIYPIGVSNPENSVQTSSIVSTKPMEIIRLVFVGTLSYKRKLCDLVKEISLLPEDILRILQLDIYGDGDDYEPIKKLIIDYQLTNVVKLKGLIAQSKLNDLLRKYHIGIGWVPYELYDNAPSLKSIEYMSQGILPLLSDTRSHLDFKFSDYFCEYFSMSEGGFSSKLVSLLRGDFSSLLKRAEENIKIQNTQSWGVVAEKYIIPAVDDLLGEQEDNKPFVENDFNCHLSVIVDSYSTYVENKSYLHSLLKENDETLRITILVDDHKCQVINLARDGENCAQLDDFEAIDAIRAYSNGKHILLLARYSRGARLTKFINSIPFDVIEMVSPSRTVLTNRDDYDSELSADNKTLRDFLFYKAERVYKVLPTYMSRLERELIMNGKIKDINQLCYKDYVKDDISVNPSWGDSTSNLKEYISFLNRKFSPVKSI